MRRNTTPTLLVLLALSSTAAPAQAAIADFEEYTVKCPVCGEEVVFRVPTAADSSGGVSLDLAVYSAGGLEPWRYWIAYSPECGYADWAGRFVNEPPLEDAEFIEKAFGPDETDATGVVDETEEIRRGELPLWEQYRNLYLLERHRGASDVELADILLCGWWCLRGENVERETRLAYRSTIVESLENALRRGEIGENQLAERVYLIGELARRTGDVVEARHRLGEALTMPGAGDSDIAAFIEHSLLLTEAQPLRRRVLEGGCGVVSHPRDAGNAAHAVACWDFLRENPSSAVERGDAALAAWYYGARLGWTDDTLAVWRESFEEAYAAEVAERPLIYTADELDALRRLAAGGCACDD